MSHRLSMGFHTSTLGIPCIRPFETEYTGMGPIYPDRLLMYSMYVVHTCVVLCISVIMSIFSNPANQQVQEYTYYLGIMRKIPRLSPDVAMYIPVPCPGAPVLTCVAHR